MNLRRLPLPTKRVEKVTPLHQIQTAPEDNEEGTISLLYIGEVIYRHLFLGALLVPFGAALFFLISSWLPPIYKSPAVINIQSSYFRGPLVNDLIAEEHDHGELLTQRDSLIRLALSDSFILSLYKRFPELEREFDVPYAGIERDERLKALAITRFRDNLEFFGLSGSTFHIAAMASTQNLALTLSQTVVAEILLRLNAERQDLLERTRQAISSHVRELGRELRAIEQSLRVSDEQSMNEELVRVQADLDSLLLHYTEKHPKVFQLRQEAKSLESRIQALKKSSLESDGIEIPRSAAAQQPTQDVYNELLRKLSYLQIALSLEDEEGTQHIQVITEPIFPLYPFFPNKLLFVSLGAIFGVVLWVIIATYRELAPPVSALPVSSGEAFADFAKIPFFGKLPPYEAEMNVRPGSPPTPDIQEPPEVPTAVVIPHRRISVVPDG